MGHRRMSASARAFGRKQYLLKMVMRSFGMDQDLQDN